MERQKFYVCEGESCCKDIQAEPFTLRIFDDIHQSTRVLRVCRKCYHKNMTDLARAASGR